MGGNVRVHVMRIELRNAVYILIILEDCITSI